MFRSCLFALLLYAAIATGYWFWLDTVFDTPGSYWGAAGLGLVVFLCLGALINAKTAWNDWSLASAARSQTPPRDGRMMAACGPIQPVDKPLLAPFSNMPCCLVEYDLSQESKSFSNDSDAKTGSDLAGFLMTPSEVQTGAGNVRLLGFPILEEGSSYTLRSFTAARRARDFVSLTQFEDISGLRLVNVFSAIQDAWTDEDGYVEKNLQLKKVDPQALFPDDLEAVWQEVYGEQPVDEPDVELGRPTAELEDEVDDEDDDLDDEDSGPPLPNIPIPTLKENRVSPGDQVCVIGRYDEMRRGVKPTGAGMQALRLIRGSIETLESKARGTLVSHLLGGIFFLILAHAATCFVMWAYLNNSDNLRKRTNLAFQAARDKDVTKLERLVKRGLSINVRNSDERTLLMESRDPETVAWLIAQKIDLNAVDKYNYTALKWAVTSDQIPPKQQLDIVKLLVEAKADLNIRDKTGKTALMEADQRGKEEVANLLRFAGAVDDRITAENSDPLPDDGGEQLAVVKQYVSSIFQQDATTLRNTLTSPFTYEADEKLWKGWQGEVFEPFEKFEGYTRGDNAVVIVYRKSKLFDNANAKMTFQLRRLNGRWKVADKRLDIN